MLENPNDKPSIGKTLREARDKQGLSAEEVAAKLKLKPKTIAALEADDFDSLPALTYVKGHVRNYARIVDLDADTLIDLLTQETTAQTPKISPVAKPPGQTGSKDQHIKTFSYLMTFSLVILIIAWWQSQNTVTKDLSAGSTDSEGAVYPQGFTYKYDIVTHAEVPSSNEIETNIGEIIGTKQLPLDSPPIERPDSEVNSPASDQDTIAMLLDAESWIEIYDVSGRELYRKLAKPGETLNLSGTAPFSVKLGNAGGVSLRFNGEEFNPSAYTRGGVANFVLGGNQISPLNQR